jgi:cyclopropane fatty-acyl-phospholipid synthase-like methyltransferase
MLSQFLRLSKKIIKNLLGLDGSDKQVRTIYEEKEYLEAYSQHTDLRVEADPKAALGGMWEEIGQLQFEFLITKDMQPYHNMLDIGCGTLRGGRHSIKYLNTGKYHCIDISPNALAYAKQFVQQEGLIEKSPHLLVSENKNLKFREFSGDIFDYILAQSVFTHLKPEHIKECFENIGKIMHKNSAFYFTYKQGEEYSQIGFKDFLYPFPFFESLAEQNRFKLQDCSKEYNHPRGQRMVELMKNQTI